MSKKHRLAKRATEAKAEVAVNKDTSPWILQNKKLGSILNIKEHYQWTKRQSAILETAEDKSSKVIIIDGYWGVGKSALAVLTGLKQLNEKKSDGIVYIRNALESTSSGKVGLLPGSLEERMSPYNVILYDKLREFVSKADIDHLKKEGRIECIPVSFLQGKTFTCKTVIIDEAASMSYEDLLLAISRIGERCKVFIIGDSTFQLTLGARSGFKRFLDHFNDEESKENGIYVFELKNPDDILRSGLIRYVLQKTGAIPRATQTNGPDWLPSG